MIRIELANSDVYINARKYWLKEIYEQIWTDSHRQHEQEFIQWLADQGVEILRNRIRGTVRVVDRFGVDPYSDEMVFDDDADATIFVLRWS